MPPFPDVRTLDTPVEKNRLDGFEHDEDVEAEREILDVEKVVLQLLHRVLNRCAVGVAHLGPAGDSGFDHVALAVERNLLLELADELRALRPWSDERHVPTQHVPQLRYFV